MEIVVLVAISILGAIFLTSLIGLILVCRHKYCRRLDLITAQHKETNPDVQLIGSSGDVPRARWRQPRTGTSSAAELELQHVTFTNPQLDDILADEDWVDDVSGLLPHCIAILSTCHHLTERLVGLTMNNAHHIRTEELLTDIIAVAKRISPRVDEIVKCMYPPLDPRLLEARCTALVLSVSHLVLVTKHACHLPGDVDWIDQSLADVEDHLRVLKEASVTYAASQSHTVLPSSMASDSNGIAQRDHSSSSYTSPNRPKLIMQIDDDPV